MYNNFLSVLIIYLFIKKLFAYSFAKRIRKYRSYHSSNNIDNFWFGWLMTSRLVTFAGETEIELQVYPQYISYIFNWQLYSYHGIRIEQSNSWSLIEATYHTSIQLRKKCIHLVLLFQYHGTIYILHFYPIFKWIDSEISKDFIPWNKQNNLPTSKNLAKT